MMTMETTIASRLAARLIKAEDKIANRVSDQLLETYPELIRTLRLEGTATPQTRLSQVGPERLSAVVRGVLVFETLSVADQEIQWAAGVLPRSGVKQDHQTAMVRWFFDEVRALDLEEAEQGLVDDIEKHLMGLITTYHA